MPIPTDNLLTSTVSVGVQEGVSDGRSMVPVPTLTNAKTKRGSQRGQPCWAPGSAPARAPARGRRKNTAEPRLLGRGEGLAMQYSYIYAIYLFLRNVRLRNHKPQ